MILFGIFSVDEFMKFIAFFALINAIIHMMVIIFYIAITNDTLRDWAFVVAFMMISFASGIILPLTSMGKVFRAFSRLNIVTLGHNLLLGYSLTFERVLVIILYFAILTVSISYIHRRRWV